MKKVTSVAPEAIRHVPHLVHRAPLDRRHPRSRAALQRRILDEFNEMCGHPVSLTQAARLFGVPHDACRRILDELARQGALRRVRGHYTLASARP